MRAPLLDKNASLYPVIQIYIIVVIIALIVVVIIYVHKEIAVRRGLPTDSLPVTDADVVLRVSLSSKVYNIIGILLCCGILLYTLLSNRSFLAAAYLLLYFLTALIVMFFLDMIAGIRWLLVVSNETIYLYRAFRRNRPEIIPVSIITSCRKSKNNDNLIFYAGEKKLFSIDQFIRKDLYFLYFYERGVDMPFMPF